MGILSGLGSFERSGEFGLGSMDGIGRGYDRGSAVGRG